MDRVQVIGENQSYVLDYHQQVLGWSLLLKLRLGLFPESGQWQEPFLYYPGYDSVYATKLAAV